MCVLICHKNARTHAHTQTHTHTHTHLQNSGYHLRQITFSVKIIHCILHCIWSLSPPSRTFTTPVSPAKPSALQVIPPTRHTTSSVCYHQGGDWGVSKPGQTDWKTASSTRLSGSWTPSRPCPPSPLLPHESLNSDPHPTTTTPTHPHEHTHTHTHTHTETSTGHLYSIGLTSFNYLFWQSEQKRLLLVTLNSLISSLHYTINILHCLFVCLFVSLICTICHVPYATLSIFLYYYF